MNSQKGKSIIGINGQFYQWKEVKEKSLNNHGDRVLERPTQTKMVVLQ